MLHARKEGRWLGCCAVLSVAVHLSVVSMTVVDAQSRYLARLGGDYSTADRMSDLNANLLSPVDLLMQENAVDTPLDFRNCFFSPVQCLLSKKPTRSYRNYRISREAQ
uniref:Uncharacterized protein n=1 Tax=Plectus sambesii TaxID=2011161 RepID=A0A914WFJ4_9BILA